MESEKKIKELLMKAADAGLDGLDFLRQFSFAELVEGYNGIGPEFLPAALREKVTHYLATFEPAALIHDLRNHVGDGTRFSFNFANYEFLANCRKLAKYAYSWFNWRRYRALAVAELLYDFVSGQPGWIAWCEASRKHRQKGNHV